MKYIVALAALTAAVTAQTPPGCSTNFDGTFVIKPTRTNETSSSSSAKFKRQQNVRTICGSTPVITLKDGTLTDQQGRTGEIVANSQYQFDELVQKDALFTNGFSVCQNNTLAVGGSAIFYQCLSGDPNAPEDRSKLFNNLYTKAQGPTSGEAQQCSESYIEVIGCEVSPEQSSSFALASTSGTQQPTSVPAPSTTASSAADTAPSTTATPAAPYPVGNNGTAPAPTPTASGSNPTTTTGTGSPAPSPFVPGSGASTLIIGGKLIALVAGIGAFAMF
ncbi:MAG: hypothetical protein L6R40_006572 [Gallowayella cf. fulva]|nr:MAG: hypothetical protein L6R40_006572 [Xanthomendoza cf. fulva]